MNYAVTTKQMGRIDDYMINVLKIPGIVLMENASRAVVDHIMQKFAPKSLSCPARAVVFCGCGNNGGDGFAVARGLLSQGFDVHAILVGDEQSVAGDARTNMEFFHALGERLFLANTPEDLKHASNAAGEADVIVDALFGTGLKRDLSGLYKEAVDIINEMCAYKVSVDIPSGISGDTGAVMGAAVRADATVTFQYPKIGHCLYPGKEYAGELKVAQIGVDKNCPVLDEVDVCIFDERSRDIGFEKRSSNTNKGDYGRLLIIAGSVGMAGAAVLASRAACRTGAGLVNLASMDYVVNVVQKSMPEIVCRILPGEMDSITKNAVYEVDRFIREKNALAVGPGISENQDTQELVNHLVVNHNIVKVFDADALNVISRNMDVLLRKTGDVILTPHPKEFSRLSDMDVRQILADPIRAARDFTAKYDVTLVLKGTVTIIANRKRGITLVATGSPGMARGGSGDVLTGIIASLASQGKDAWDAAVLGVLVNGLAGKYAAEQWGEYSMSPEDTIGMIGKAISALTRKDILAAPRQTEVKYTAAKTVNPTAFKTVEKAQSVQAAEEAMPPEEEPAVSETADIEPEETPAKEEIAAEIAAESQNGYVHTDKEEYDSGIGLDKHFTFLSPDEELKQKIAFGYGEGGAEPAVEGAKLVKPVTVSEDERFPKPGGKAKSQPSKPLPETSVKKPNIFNRNKTDDEFPKPSPVRRRITPKP
jgi:hydroxyethylthiazole kinase-like uncharacterized protein yjeF